MWLKEHINQHHYSLRRRIRHAEIQRWRSTLRDLDDCRTSGCTLDTGVILSYWGALCYRAPRPAIWYRTRYIWHGAVYKRSPVEANQCDPRT